MRMVLVPACLLVAIFVLGGVIAWNEADATDSFIQKKLRGSPDAECITNKLLTELNEKSAEALQRQSVTQAEKDCRKERSREHSLEQGRQKAVETRQRQYQVLTDQIKR